MLFNLGGSIVIITNTNREESFHACDQVTGCDLADNADHGLGSVCCVSVRVRVQACSFTALFINLHDTDSVSFCNPFSHCLCLFSIIYSR